MARLENGSYDEIVAHLVRELEVNALEESDDLTTMTTMTPSASQPKTPLSTGQTSDITCNYCKEKGHMVKDCEKLKKKKENMPKMAHRLRRKFILSVGLVGRRTILRKDVGKVQVRTSNPSAPDLRIQTIINWIRKFNNLRTNQHSPIPNLHPRTMIQKIASPGLQYSQLVSVRHYIRSDLPKTIFFTTIKNP